MRHALRYLIVALAALSCTSQAFGQGAAYQNHVENAIGETIAGASVAICASNLHLTVTPCTDTIALYSNQTLTTAIANPMPTDGLGNFQFFAAPGSYWVQQYDPRIVTASYPITLGNGGAGGTPFIQAPNSLFVGGPGNTSTTAGGPAGTNGQVLLTAPIAALLQGQTFQHYFTAWQPSNVLIGPLTPPGALGGIDNAGSCHMFVSFNSTQTCTITLQQPSIAGDSFIAIADVNAQTGTGSAGFTGFSDAAGDNFGVRLGNTGVYRASNIAAGTTQVTCSIQIAGTQQGQGACILLETYNDLAVDQAVRTVGPGSASNAGVQSVTASYTPNFASENLIIFTAQGSDWTCLGANVTYNPQLYNAAGGLFEQDVSGFSDGIYVTGGDFGIAGTNATTFSMTVSGIQGAFGCPGSAGVTPEIDIIGLRPTVGAVPQHFPTTRLNSCGDLLLAGVGLGVNCNNTSSGVAGANLGYQYVAVSGTALFPRNTANFIPGTGIGVSCADNSGAGSTDCTFTSTATASSFQTNGTNNTSQAGLNFINPAAFNGLTFTWSNPTTTQETFAVGGTLGNAGLTNSSITVNGTLCTLGSTCTPSGSGNISGSGTVNHLMKWSASTTAADSTATDDGTNPTRTPNGSNTGVAGNFEEYTVDTGGVSAGLLACVTSNVDGAGRSKVVTCPLNSVAGLVGVAKSTVASGGTALVCWTLNCSILTDNASTVRDTAVVSSTTQGEIHDSGGQTTTAGTQNFVITTADTGAGTASIASESGLLAANPAGGGGGKGTAVQVNGTPTKGTANFASSASVTVSGTNSGNTTTVMFTAAGGSATTAPAQTVLAGPITVPNGNGGVNGPVTVCESAIGAALVNCVINGPSTPSQPLVVGQFWLMVADFATHVSGTCTLTDSLGNIITTIQSPNNGHAFFTMPVTVGGTTDTITMNATTCAPAANNTARQVWMIMNVVGVSASDSAVFNTDDVVNNPQELDITTTRAYEPVIIVGSNGSIGEAHDFSSYPAPVLLLSSHGFPAFDVRLAGTGAPGTYKFFIRSDVQNFSNTEAISFIPNSPLVGQTVCTSASGGNVGSCASGTATAIGQTIAAIITPLAGAQTSCAASDQLGNTYVSHSDFTNQLGVFVSKVTVAGTPTVTFTSCAGLGGSAFEQADIAVLTGVAFSQGPVDFKLAAPYNAQTAFPQDYLFSFINTQAAGTWTNDPQFHGIASSTSNPAYSVSDFSTNIPAVYSIAPTFAGTQNTTTGAVLAFSLSPPPVYPLVPRQPVSTDITPPQLVTQTIPQGAVTYTADGSQAGSWVSTLTVNLTALTLSHMQDGVTYSFSWAQNGTGGYLVTCPANVNFCPPVDTVANHVTVWRGVWNAAQNELAFYSTTSPAMCINATASPSCGSALAGFVVIPVGATSTTVLDSAIQTNDVIAVHEDSSLGAALAVTCNTTILGSAPEVTARTAATSFVITPSASPATNPGCYSFTITHTLTAGPLDPPAVTRGLVLNYDANFQSGTNNTAAPTLTDYSGNNNTATSATGATFLTNQINGLPAWSWPGTSAGQYSLATNLPATSFTIFWEFQYNSSGGTILSGPSNSLVLTNTGANVMQLFVNGGGAICQSTTTLTSGTFYQMNVTYNSSTGVCAWRTTEAASGGATATSSPGAFNSLGFTSGGTSNANYKISQLLYYSVILTAAEINADEAGWKVKFGN